MNEDKTLETPALTSPPPPVDKDASAEAPAGAPRSLAIWLALLALLGVGALAWLAWQGNARIESTREELARRLTDSDAVQREAQANAKQNREALDALQAKVGALEASLAEMQSQQILPEVHLVLPNSRVEATVRSAIRRGINLIVVAGGDGTVDSVAGVMMGSPATLGIIPTGTGNVFARDAGLPFPQRSDTSAPVRAARIIIAGDTDSFGAGEGDYLVGGVGRLVRSGIARTTCDDKEVT